MAEPNVIDLLREMFPVLSKDTIEDVLRSQSHNVGAARTTPPVLRV